MFKARTHNLIRSTDGNYGTHWTYLCDNGMDIKECFEPNFFSTLKSNLLAGDTIRVIEMTGKRGPVKAACLGIVISVHESLPEVIFKPYDDAGIHYYKDDSSPEEKEDPYQLPPKFIEGSGQVEKDENSGMYVVKCDGKIICETEKKGLAMAISRGDTPIPQLTKESDAK